MLEHHLVYFCTYAKVSTYTGRVCHISLLNQTPVCECSDKNSNVTIKKGATLIFRSSAATIYLIKHLRTSRGKTKTWMMKIDQLQYYINWCLKLKMKCFKKSIYLGITNLLSSSWDLDYCLPLVTKGKPSAWRLSSKYILGSYTKVKRGWDLFSFLVCRCFLLSPACANSMLASLVRSVCSRS